MTLTERTARQFLALEAHPQPPLIRLRHPVVLMHGFGLYATLWREGMFHDEAMHLRTHGVWAFAPNVSPYHTVATRAEQWDTRLKHVLRETGADRLNLVAHSMGGLDARFLISRRGWHDRVATLTTISSPHHGASAADYLMEQPERVRQFVAGAADWLGARALSDDATADFLRAVRELRPEYVQDTFNPDTPNHPSVRYGSFAGRAGAGTDVPLNPFFRPLNRVIYEREGVNDGYVAVESARWGDFHGTVDADHARQVGLAAAGLRTAPDIHAFYREVVEALADEGF
jgi:triacylglycerol lipase